MATRLLALQIARGQRCGAVAQQRRIGAGEQNTPAVLARARAQIDDVIGRPHHVGIVLHDDDRVAEIAQFFEDADQPRRVARVQADGRLIEHIAGAHQPRAEAGRKLDALRFAAGERRRQAVEREVMQPDIVQEFQPLPDLDQDLIGDRILFRRELQRVEELAALRPCSCVTSCGDRSCRRRARTALPCAAASRGNRDTAHSRDTG